MKDFFQKVNERLQQWAVGRNGFDALSQVVYFLGLVLFVVQWFVKTPILYYLSWGCLIYGLFRVFSKNIAARQKENQAFLGLFAGLGRRWNLLKRQWKDRKTHRYFSCPSCHQTVRVPKHPGKVKIHCPRCGNSFEVRM